MAFSFKKWIFKQLPGYFKENDTYLDNNKEGLFERYTRNFDYELDEEVLPFIRDVYTILDPSVTDAKYLGYIAYLLGDIPITTIESANRTILRFAIMLFQTKGTIPSAKMVFNAFGLGVDLMEVFGPRPIRYDNDPLQHYDDNTQYDIDCPRCNDYYLAYWSWDDNCTTGVFTSIPQTTLDAIRQLICLIEPIDTTFKGFIRKYNVCDTLTLDIDEEVTILPGLCSIPQNPTSDDSLGNHPVPMNPVLTPNVNEADLSWDPPTAVPSNFIYYEVGYRVNPNGPWTIISNITDEFLNSIVLIGGQNFDFKIRAVYDTGYSEWVFISNQTIPAASCSLPTNINVVDHL